MRFAQSAVSAGDSTRIAEESSLLIMDIIVELEDGIMVNVEMQKIGYLFPGEFHNYPDTCYHFFEQKSDTGLQIELLQDSVYER